MTDSCAATARAWRMAGCSPPSAARSSASTSSSPCAPLRTRYVPETGDVVLGRVVDIAGKRWKLDVGGRQDAILQLGAVHLPGGAQRRRNTVDELNMRALYAENDLISCEVQSFYADGAVALHTRSLKYGRLANGQLVRAPPTLVKRVKRHFHAVDPEAAFGAAKDAGVATTEETTSGKKRKSVTTTDPVTDALGVEVLLGCNGFVWVGARSAATGEGELPELPERTEGKNATKTTRLAAPRARRERVCRVANAVRVLSALFLAIHPRRHRGRRALLGRVGDRPEGHARGRVQAHARARDGAPVRQGGRVTFLRHETAKKGYL